MERVINLSAKSPPDMDLTYLSNLMGGNELLAQKFVNIFKSQAPEQVTSLGLEIRDQNWKNVSGIAHSLKSQFEYLALKSFAEQMIRIEELADEDLTDAIPDLYQAFENDFLVFLKNEFADV